MTQTRTIKKQCQQITLTLTFLLLLAILTFPQTNPTQTRTLTALTTTNTNHLERIRSYDWSTSLAAVINTPKTGTGSFFLTFLRSWNCHDVSTVLAVRGLYVLDCPHPSRRAIRTHSFPLATKMVRQQREEYPNGKCLIVTAIRSPATWFASAYLQNAKEHWASTDEDMVRGFRTFLASPKSTRMMYMVLPHLLREFQGGSLIHQSRIMDRNGGYSILGPAPPTSTLAGCDLLFLRMEDSKRWPDIFRSINSGLKYEVGVSRLEQHPDMVDRINAVAAYQLTEEEKKRIYSRGDSLIRDWFNSYGYMDGAVMDENGADDGDTSGGAVMISEKV